MAKPPLSPSETLQRALAALQAGNLASAEQLCGAALKAQPKSFDAAHLAGMVAARGGKYADAERLLAQALKLNPKIAPAHANYGNVLRELGRAREALAAYDCALALKPDHPQTLNNRGVALRDLKMPVEAEAVFRKTLRLMPDFADAHNNLGMALHDQGKRDEAILSFQRAIDLRPAYADAHFNLGTALTSASRLDDAVASFRRAAGLKPAYAVFNTIGLALQQLGKWDEAIESFRKAVAFDPGAIDGHKNLATALYSQGRLAAAAGAYQKALELEADAAGAGAKTRAIYRALLNLMDFPAIYPDEPAVAAARRRFTDILAELKELTEEDAQFSEAEQGLLTECLFKLNHFFLGYQQGNDRPLLEDYCALVTKLLKADIRPFLEPIPRLGTGGKIRLGIVSEFVRNHNGANWVYPWLAKLPGADYEIFIYLLNGHPDELTEKFAALGAYRRLPFDKNSYLGTLKKIREDELDILILSDVGMSVASRIVAVTRLARIQCIGWGHPITTGSKTADYFLSGGPIEPANGQEHYTESVVRLPYLTYYFAEADVAASAGTRAQFQLPDDKTLLGSVQMLVKYLPHQDAIFARIAAGAPEALLVFIDHRSEYVTGLFKTRLAKAFAAAGLNFGERVRFLPFMPHGRFIQLFDILDVNLDCMGWSGGNTNLFSLAHGCPVVTLPGEFTRGRHSYEMLRRIGLDELIAATPDDYVSLAVKLAGDRDYREAVAGKIRQNKARLLDYAEYIHAIDGFFKSKAIRR